MERDANYVAVGSFALLVIAMAVAFVLWYSDSGDRRDYTTYEIYFTGSVSGLTAGSPVRYLGVDVGSVRRLTLDRNRPGSVKIIANVDSEAPISGATRASLGLQGITGLLYVNLKEVSDAAGAELKQGERYPVIESQSSDIDAFIASLPQLAGRINALVDNVSSVFSPDNVQALSTTLDNLRDASKGLPQTHAQTQALLEELNRTAVEIRTAAGSANTLLSETTPEVKSALRNLDTAVGALGSAATKLNNVMASSEAPLTHFTEQGLFEVEQTLKDARAAAAELSELSRSLKENPSQLMFERRESGVEIKP